MLHALKIYTTLFIVFMLNASTLFAQPNEDSLLHIANSTIDDSIKFRQFFELVKGYKYYDLEKTKEFNDSIAIVSKRTKNPRYKGISDYYYGFYYRKKDEYDKAIEFFQKAKNNAIEHKYYSIYAVSISEIAGIYTDKGLLAKALEINIEAANFNESKKDINSASRLSTNYNSIGLIYVEMKEYQNALKYYHKAIQTSSAAEDRSIPYGNMAEIFLLLNQVDSLNFYAEKCFELEYELQSPRGLAYAEWLRAEAYLIAEKYQLAEQSANKSIQLYQKYPEKILMIKAYNVLTKALLKNGKNSLAIENANLGLSLAEETNNLILIKNSHGILASSYEQNKQYALALVHSKIMTNHQDSLDLVKDNKLLQDLSIKYETAQKNEEIASQKLKIAKKDTQRYGLLAGLILLALIFTLFAYRYKSNQKISNQKIELLKQEKKLLSIDYMFQGQEEERKRIAQDLHDGLGGILSVAKIQIRSIQKEIEKLESLKLISKTEDLIESAYNEVRRISHDMMPGALVNLGLFAAIEDLAEQMNLTKQVKIKTQWYTSDELLPEKSTPIIYRIVQEAITNTMKYAKAENMLIQMTEREQGFNLAIEDDGVGFDLEHMESEGLGIKSIQSRVDYLNGEMEIDTKPNEGTKYEIFIPR